MSSTNNLTGLVLDRHLERTVEIDLPLVKRSRSVEYKDEIISSSVDKFGELMLFGDWHLGHSAHASNPFNAYIKLILDNPHMRVGLMGDYIEYSARSKFISDETLTTDQQIELFIKYLSLIKDQVVFILAGNHGAERMARYTGSQRWLKSIVSEAGIDTDKVYVGEPQRGVSSIIKSGEQLYSMYAHHGSTGAIVNKNTQLRRMAGSRRQTVLAMGHIHNILWEPRIYEEQETTESGDIMNAIKMQYWVSSGGFVKDASYAEAKSYPLNSVGAPILRFFSTKNDIDMWQIPYRSHYFDGGVSLPTPDIDWSKLRPQPSPEFVKAKETWNKF